MTTRLEESSTMPWPERPSRLGDGESPRDYLTFYRDWLTSELGPEAIAAVTSLREAFQRAELVGRIARKWMHLVPHGHGVDSTANELGKIGEHLAPMPWFVAYAGEAATHVIADPSFRHPAVEAVLEQAARTMCDWIAPLHAAEALVRSDAVAALDRRGKSLPAAARKLVARDVLKGSGQLASREVLLASVTDDATASTTAVEPPVDHMQAAWLADIWPTRRSKLLALQAIGTPRERLAIDQWLDDMQAAHPLLNVEHGFTDQERAEWEEYKAALIEQVTAEAAVQGANGKIRLALKPRFGEELAADAFTEALARIRDRAIHQGRYRSTAKMLLFSCALDLQRRQYDREAQTAPNTITDADGDETSRFEHIADDRREGTSLPSEFAPVGPVHVHLARMLAEAVGAKTATGMDSLARLIDTCAEETHPHDADVSRELMRVVRTRSQADLAEEVIHHMAASRERLEAAHPDAACGLDYIVEDMASRIALADTQGKRLDDGARSGGEPSFEVDATEQGNNERDNND